MTQISKQNLGRYAVLAVTFVTALVLMHWSINTLLDLVSGTVFQFKHTLAVFILLLTARVVIFPRNNHPNRSQHVNRSAAQAG